MVLASSSDIFSSQRYLCFIGGQDPVLFIKEDQFSQMPGKDRNLSRTSPIIYALLLWSILPLQPVGHLTCVVGQFNLSQGKRASHFLSIHPSVRGDLLFLIAPEGFLVISETLCFSSWRQQLSPFITFAADSFQSAAPCSCLPKPIFSQLPEAA